ncbi:helix-turn-helix domain-containing protein [Brevundimonas sp.]
MSRSAKLPRDRLAELRDQGVGATDIARLLGIGRASVYRFMGDRLATPA